jgi:hypothetical protein
MRSSTLGDGTNGLEFLIVCAPMKPAIARSETYGDRRGTCDSSWIKAQNGISQALQDTAREHPQYITSLGGQCIAGSSQGGHVGLRHSLGATGYAEIAKAQTRGWNLMPYKGPWHEHELYRSDQLSRAHAEFGVLATPRECEIGASDIFIKKYQFCRGPRVGPTCSRTSCGSGRPFLADHDTCIPEPTRTLSGTNGGCSRAGAARSAPLRRGRQGARKSFAAPQANPGPQRRHRRGRRSALRVQLRSPNCARRRLIVDVHFQRLGCREIPLRHGPSSRDCERSR